MEVHNQKPAIVAHRGVADGINRENTIQAFERAITMGADYIETDVRATADGCLICFHDPSWQNKKIHQMTYDELVKKTKTFGWEPPLLADILELCKGKIKVNLEVKEKGFEEKMLAITAEKSDISELFVSSFFDAVIEKVKVHSGGEMKTGLVLGRSLQRQRLQFSRYHQHLFPEARLTKLNADIVCPHFSLLRFGFVKRMHAMDIPVFTWTVNDQSRMKKVAEQQVDGLITDRVSDAQELLSQR